MTEGLGGREQAEQREGVQPPQRKSGDGEGVSHSPLGKQNLLQLGTLRQPLAALPVCCVVLREPFPALGLIL